MFKRFYHNGLEQFFADGNRKGIRPEHAQRLKEILFRLHHAAKVDYMDFPSARLHQLKDDRVGTRSVTVSGNWRILFRFDSGHAWDVDYDDYH